MTATVIALSSTVLLNKKWRRVFVAFTFLVIFWLLSWASARFLIVSATLQHADAIVVLSGSSTLAERVEHAAHLYAEKRSSRILLTTDNQQGGWSVSEQRNPYFAEIAVRELSRLGVPLEAIEVVGPAVNSTWEEASLISQYSKSHNFGSILVVTSSYHSRRALLAFRIAFRGTNIQVGLDPVATGIQTPTPATWWLHFRGWKLVMVEYLKLIYYLLRSL